MPPGSGGAAAPGPQGSGSAEMPGGPGSRSSRAGATGPARCRDRLRQGAMRRDPAGAGDRSCRGSGWHAGMPSREPGDSSAAPGGMPPGCPGIPAGGQFVCGSGWHAGWLSGNACGRQFLRGSGWHAGWLSGRCLRPRKPARRLAAGRISCLASGRPAKDPARRQ